MKVDIYGTLGPSCDDEEVLFKMFAEGMTGMRINLSHVRLTDAKESVQRIQLAAERFGTEPLILIDMQGPELRIGSFEGRMILKQKDLVYMGEKGIPVDKKILGHLEIEDEILLDDGKILGRVTEKGSDLVRIRIERPGTLTGRKSIAVVGRDISLGAVSEDDRANLQVSSELGISGIMQPFVRSRKDLEEVRRALFECGCSKMKIFAKIENRAGIENLESYFDLCDEIVIARGDLGNSMPLWELPRAQKDIAARCNKCGMPFMVVTQMLSSMENSPVPTRAEVSDIYNAVMDGAASVMVTGETAIGKYPVEVIRYLAKTANM